MVRITTLAVVPLFVAVGCGTSSDGPVTTPSVRAHLQWKRNAALERDLMRALELEANEVCQEFGARSCTREVHHIALGGADPLEIGLYAPLPDTLALTPVVTDRVVLSACTSRAQLDRAAGTDAIVFSGLDLDAAIAPAHDAETVTRAIEALYRRFLSRDPQPEEVQRVAQLTRGPDGQAVSTYDFAVLSCFTIGTTTEFLFF